MANNDDWVHGRWKLWFLVRIGIVVEGSWASLECRILEFMSYLKLEALVLRGCFVRIINKRPLGMFVEVQWQESSDFVSTFFISQAWEYDIPSLKMRVGIVSKF